MGLFSSKTVYHGDVVTNLAIPYDEHKNFTRETIMTGVIGNEPLTTAIKDTLLNGFATTANSYYQYGRDKYLYGLPTGTLRSGEIIEAPIKEALESIRHTEVDIEEITLNYLDPITLSMYHLDVKFGFDVENLIIKDRIDPNTSGEFTQYFLRASLVPDEDIILVEYLYNDELKEYTFPILDFDRNQLYISVSYRVPSEDYRLRLWLYRTSSGLHPAIQLDTLFTESEYMPVCAVRKEFNSIKEGMPEYESARRMLNILGIDVADIIDALASDGSNADSAPSYPPTTPGDDFTEVQALRRSAGFSIQTASNQPDENIPEDIRDAFVVFKADINSEDQWVRKYLFDYFKDQAAFQKPLEKTKEKIDSLDLVAYRPNEIIIENEIIQSNIFFNYILVETKEGVIGEVGEIKTEIDIQESIQRASPFTGDITVYQSTITYRKQLNETHYEEVFVHGPVHTHDIGGKYVVIRTLDDAIEPDNDTGFYIPVSRRVVEQTSNAFHRAQIYQSTLAVVVYALQSTKVKWYARGAFARLIQLVAIIWTIWSWGAGSASLSWAFALQVVGHIVVHIVISMAISFAVSILTEIIGADAMMIIAAVIAAYAIYSGAFSGPEGMPWAQDLLMISNATFSGIQDNIQRNLIDLAVEYEDFLADAQAEYDKLEEINAMLKNEGYSLIDIVTRSSDSFFWESPTMFFNRTIHMGNPGVGTLSAIESYIKNKLDLPKDKPLF